jgi:hypothetical protein
MGDKKKMHGSPAMCGQKTSPAGRDYRQANGSQGLGLHALPSAGYPAPAEARQQIDRRECPGCHTQGERNLGGHFAF